METEQFGYKLMCGLNGFIGKVQNPRSVLEQMNAKIKHRGPDFSGLIFSEWWGLGHNRLSIIDTSTVANQPLSNDFGHLAFNGEIYNWRELAKKHNLGGFNLSSDTHLLANLLSKQGIAQTLKEIRGIYAFVWVDNRAKTINLVRDKFGTKPIYIYKQEENIFFSSEIRTFTAINSWKSRLNRNALQSYLTFQNQFSTDTLFLNVQLLKPGKWLEIDRNHNTKEFDNSLDIEGNSLDHEEFISELDTRFRDAINRNLIADVPVGSFLSGGIDSSLIASYATTSGFNLETFTIGFNLRGASDLEKNFDESATARLISNKLRTKHHESTISELDMTEAIDQVSWAVEDPRVGQSYPNMYAAELASKHVKVCLSGTGGDELFGGYPWRYLPILDASNPADQASKLLKLWHRLGSVEQIASLLGLDAQSQKEYAERQIAQMFTTKELGAEVIGIKDILKFEQLTFLHGLLLVEDKLSMKYSIEVRVPFLDEDLASLAQSMPISFLYEGSQQPIDENNLNNYRRRETQKELGKVALRQLSKSKLPEIHDLRKQGFSSPDASWFKRDKHGIVEDRLLNQNSCIWEFLDYRTAEKMINEHKQSITNHRLFIWSLLTLESTIRQFQISA